MKSRSFISLFMLMFVLTMSNAAWAIPTAAEITGEIERLTLDDPTNIYSGGVMIVGGTQVILPKNLLIDLPANRLSLQQIFAQAPATCVALNESGLAKADRCNTSATGGFATLSAVHSNAGNIIAGDVLIEKGKDVVSGVVTYINYTDGYFRVNGTPGSATTGAMVRLNDPTGKHTVQQGAGCAGGPNCSPDPRFTLDPDNYTNAFSSGYPICIPSTVTRTVPAPGLPVLVGATTIPAVTAGPTQSDANGAGDKLCPSTNRTPASVTEPDVADSRLFAPIVVGDSLNSEGNFETINGTRFLSAHTTRVNKALSTKNQAGQPDYMFLEEVFVEAPAFQNLRARMLIIGFTTLPTDVDFWTIHRDPTTNGVHEFPLASITGCEIAAGVGTCGTLGLGGGGGAGGNIFRIRYDVDFLLARTNPQGKYPGGAKETLNPCWQLLNSPRFSVSNPGLCPGGSATGVGITFENNFGIMSPIPHEIQARTGHRLDAPAGSLVTLDITGAQAANGQYLFPFGMNLGGVETADFLEVDINLLSTPRVFEGIPWNLDRRLSPSGCLNAGGCEGAAMGSFALDPFPYTGLDPRMQADVIGGAAGGTPKGAYNDPNFTANILNTAIYGASNRALTYVTAAGRANGNATVLPYVQGSFPADPALIAIVPTPVLNIFPPIAVEDAATTNAGVDVTIDVLANDIPVFGTIDPTTVQIASNPASGSIVTVNATTGAITYRPTATFTVGTSSFTYTVANNFGSRSNAGTVTVTITATPPVANNDSGSARAGATSIINVIANDTATAPAVLNPASLTVTAPTGGSAAANSDGTVSFTAPNTTGTYTFTYTVKDNSTPPSTSNAATVTVTVGTTATMISPVDATTLTGASQAFTWTSTGAELYQVWVGTSLGTFNVGAFPQNGTTGTTTTATGLPTNGVTLYVRLWSRFGGTWYSNDYTYLSSGTPTPATMSSPANASTLAGASQTFSWSNAGANLYQIWVGTSPGALDLGYFPASGTVATSTTATGLPTTGGNVYVRLWSKFGTTWHFNDYTYTAAGTQLVPNPSTMASPANASVLTGASQLFSWTNTGADLYQIWIGTTQGTFNIGAFPQNGTTSFSTLVSSLPANGSAINVRLWSKFGTTWVFNDYTYTSNP